MYDSFGGEVTVGWEDQERLHGEMRIELGPEGWLRFILVLRGRRGTEQRCRGKNAQDRFVRCELDL